MGDRVSQVDIDEIVENTILEKDSVSWGPNATFQFPKYNGTGGIWESIGNSFDTGIQLNSNVEHINVEDKVLTYKQDGVLQFEEYDYIINTMPLDLFMRDVAEFDDEDQFVGDNDGDYFHLHGLIHNSTNVIGIGLKGEIPPSLNTKCWMYFPEGEYAFYRCTIFSNYSKHNIPDDNHWSLMFEVNESGHTKAFRSKEHIIEEVISGAVLAGLLDEADIVSTYYKKVDYGYPIPTTGRDEYLNKIQPYLMGKDIYSRGRFGGYKYEVSNMDHSFMQGVEAIDSILLGMDELTYFRPEHINGKSKSNRRFKSKGLRI